MSHSGRYHTGFLDLGVDSDKERGQESQRGLRPSSADSPLVKKKEKKCSSVAKEKFETSGLDGCLGFLGKFLPAPPHLPTRPFQASGGHPILEGPGNPSC